MHSAHQVLVAGVAANPVEARVDSQPDQPERTVLISELQVLEGLVEVLKSAVNDRDVVRRHVTLFGKFPELGQRFFRLASLAGNCVAVTQCAYEPGMTIREVQCPFKLGDGLREHAPPLVDPPNGKM